MRARCSVTLGLCLWPLTSLCQTGYAPPYQIYGGMTYLSNSYNGVPQFRSPLLGWDTGVAFPAWRGLRFKIDVSGSTGTNIGAPQHALFILGGGQYERTLGRERFFAHALFGGAGLNRDWGPHKAPGMTASFGVLLGGGVDTPLSRHFGIRAEGDLQHTNLAMVQSVSNTTPYHTPGQPHYVGRFCTGLVWTPRTGNNMERASHADDPPHSPAESDLVFEYRSSIGHIHIFAGTWWSYFHVAGIEYDRHTWGTFLRARMDYVAEILPVVILEQPTVTDAFGDPLSLSHTTVAGLGISPIGVRMLWRDGKRWKPYFIAKGGMIGFTEKALSHYASYENFTLQQSTGIQFPLNDTWDARIGVSDFHFSNGFLVPANPGIDEAMYDFGLSYRFHSKSATR